MSDEILEPELIDPPKAKAPDKNAWKKPSRGATAVVDAEVTDVDSAETRPFRSFIPDDFDPGEVLEVEDFSVEYPEDYFKNFAWEEGPDGEGYQQVQTHKEVAVEPGSTRYYKNIKDGWGVDVEEWFEEHSDERLLGDPVPETTPIQDFADAIDAKIAAPFQAVQQRIDQTAETLHKVATELQLVRSEQDEERNHQLERRNRKIRLLIFASCIAWIQFFHPLAQRKLTPEKTASAPLRDQKCIRISPPSNGKVTSEYGWRLHPRDRVWRLHSGMDYAADFGEPVRAAAIGKVVFAGWKGGYGNTVIIAHGNDLESLYAHNEKLLVKVGAKVGPGTVIAEAGSTGNSTGPHIHFELAFNRGGKIDTFNPRKLIGKDFGKECGK